MRRHAWWLGCAGCVLTLLMVLVAWDRWPAARDSWALGLVGALAFIGTVVTAAGGATLPIVMVSKEEETDGE